MIQKILVFASVDKPHVRDALERFLPWLRQRVEVRMAGDESGAAAAAHGVDCALVLGGDGMMLVAARRCAPLSIPLLGVNMGKFGFLTQATTAEFLEVFDRVLQDGFETEQRMMMDCTLRRDGVTIQTTACLNDVVVSRSALSRLMAIDLRVDGRWVNTYRADGLIVASPVGSTAHSLAASGPILTPDLQAFVICPICPHTLSNRPIVMSGSTRIEMIPRDYSEHPALTVDGQMFFPLSQNDVIEIRQAATPLRLVTTGQRTFFETLRDKLGWSGQLHYVNDTGQKSNV